MALATNSFSRALWFSPSAGAAGGCGSGACATLVLASVNNLSPRKNSIYLDGGVLDINWNNDDHVIMTGEIEKVFEGHFNG